MTIGDRVQIVADGRVGEVVNTVMLKDLGGITVLVYCNITNSYQPEWHRAGEVQPVTNLDSTLSDDLESILKGL